MGDSQAVRVRAADRGERLLNNIDAMEFYDETIACAGIEQLITDLLTDLRHYCEGEELDFPGCLRMSENHFLAELNGED